eukprot:gnl/TRDRNA2_/TRDRNA2_182724_c0_seq1.p1 gnl/TRDRNA2_/TRDRNA2_182724_c0~~gnl/TRDRNA2_/TRDRNA2_182724_c0_seq1.p1  ORF type:complete len:572 (+),score=57.60 gnl/TRDRNA2_/TRDRNA2_182724_c0_seq1:114-1829(+)
MGSHYEAVASAVLVVLVIECVHGLASSEQSELEMQGNGDECSLIRLQVGSSTAVAKAADSSSQSPSSYGINCETQDGQVCKFPFRYEGIEYNVCTSADSTEGAWCPLVSGEFLQGQPWGICRRTHSCFQATGVGTTNCLTSGHKSDGDGNVGAGEQCYFPFTYKRITYNTCSASTWRATWCPTAKGPVTFESPWGTCPDDCATDLDCVTVGCNKDAPYSCANSVGHGEKCQFPFLYKNTTYNACTTIDLGKAWCSTGAAVADVGTAWGICSAACPIVAPCATKPDRKVCVFPFDYKGSTFNSCTNLDWPHAWCPTAVPFDFINKWGVCDDACQVQSGRSGGACFPGNAKVISPTGPKELAQVRLGDELLGFNPATGQNEFTTVRAWLHRVTDVEAVFVQLHTKTGGIVVSSPGHYIAVGNRNTHTFASHIHAGHTLLTPDGSTLVTKSSWVKANGFFAPWTATANFYVGTDNGFVLAHSLANVHIRFETSLEILFSIVQFFAPSIHNFDDSGKTDYLHPIARIFWSAVDAPRNYAIHHDDSKTDHVHPIGTLIASVVGAAKVTDALPAVQV